MWAFQVAQMVKNLPAMQETWVRSQGWEDPLEWVAFPPPGDLPGPAVKTESPVSPVL